MSKNEDYKKQNHLLKLFKVMSNANRLKILKFLATQPNFTASAGDIAEAVKTSDSNLSNHLKLMRISKILSAKQDGQFMHYTLKEPMVHNLISSLL